MDPNNLPPGFTYEETLSVQSASNPKTKLGLAMLLQQRKSNPDWEMVIMDTQVCRSYPRWANIGLTPKVMPFKLPLAVFLIRRPHPSDGHPAKEIVLLDPTNAHYHETVSSPEEGIFYDVAEEIIDKIHYAIKCPCPSPASCTCGQGWTITFLRCREHSGAQKLWPGIIDGYGTQSGAIFSTIFSWHMANIIAGERERDAFLAAAAAGQLPPWEDRDTDAEKANIKLQMGCTDEQLRTGEGFGDRTAPVLNPFRPMSSTNCENCGRDEVMGDAGTEVGGELKRCGRCRIVRYCSVKCQKKDWRRHKKGCVPPPKDLGGGTILMPRMTFDPVTKQLAFKMAEDKPKLQKK